MTLKVCFFACSVFCICAPAVLGYETLNSVYFNGLAPIIADGFLDDWEEIPAPEIEVTNPILETRDEADVIPLDGPDDLAFSFRCFADNQYIYFALIVKDDEVLIDRHIFGKGWLDDSCTLYFDGDCLNVDKLYYDENDGMLKVIGSQQGGVKYIEGLIPYFYGVQVPYFWESRGVRSGFQHTDDGYISELAIPIAVLGWEDMYEGRYMGANLRVVDMDSDVIPDEVDKGLIWAEDPEHTAHLSAKSFNRIVFSETINVSDLENSSPKVSTSENGINIILEAPDGTDGAAIICAVLSDLSNDDFTAAENKLMPLSNELWIRAFLGIIQLKRGEAEKGTNQLFEFGEYCPEPWGEEWVKAYLKSEAQWLFFQYKDIITDDMGSLRYMDTIFNEYNTHYPGDSEGWFVSGEWAENTGNYENAVTCYSMIEMTSSNAERFNEAQLKIAQNLFYLSRYVEAQKVATTILNSTADNQYKLKANMVLMSIETKTGK